MESVCPPMSMNKGLAEGHSAADGGLGGLNLSGHGHIPARSKAYSLSHTWQVLALILTLTLTLSQTILGLAIGPSDKPVRRPFALFPCK